jgi:hypothetical protein
MSELGWQEKDEFFNWLWLQFDHYVELGSKDKADAYLEVIAEYEKGKP